MANVDNPANLGAEILGELVRDRILVPPLGVGRYYADAELFAGVERVREGDLSWLETLGLLAEAP